MKFSKHAEKLKDLYSEHPYSSPRPTQVGFFSLHLWQFLYHTSVLLSIPETSIRLLLGGCISKLVGNISSLHLSTLEYVYH